MSESDIRGTHLDKPWIDKYWSMMIDEVQTVDVEAISGQHDCWRDMQKAF